ncbi:LysM domain-containing protein [Geodermatophilus pulveris]|uniref:LysM domain-containing protein n=1 Tax=Geodermatophilus pulveris TaxID=1564159 RepID=A0A239C2X6_9ACTN|nr:LysM peptidoglycan-binding domain-containing protein [Geodermatophilus pulveris]SNS14645.1 LysM domain-containing protein [Geodermatophilus pulveris]
MRGHLAHQVVRGDTLRAVAREYGTDVRRLTAADELPDPDRILVGRVLRVPQE